MVNLTKLPFVMEAILPPYQLNHTEPLLENLQGETTYVLQMDLYRVATALAGETAHLNFSTLDDCQSIALTDQIKIKKDLR